ncbi:MAG TPA: twin-arginine translocase subunit TatC [Solirubrobacteraceae bacterium]|jgi:sec-independent protein translocase protein TatC|nr:twin-arginine translocase subunit TatC [Solirubrobacteraceae bacterium]
MATALRPIKHDDRLSLVEHLDELRTRMIICGVTLAVAFGVCFWQNHVLLHILNVPLQETTNAVTSGGRLSQTARQAALQRRALQQLGGAVNTLAEGAERLPPVQRAQFEAQLRAYNRTVTLLPSTIPKRQPVTLGVGEPFTTTLTTAFWFGLIFSLPIILYQIYAFVLPAFSPRERRVALPLMAMIPILFIAGVLFAYFLVLPPAIGFLQHFNDQSFDVLVQARDYYKFELLTIVMVGLIFQVPIGMVALNRAGILSAAKLRRTWRYAVVIIAVVAALLPGVDPVTTVLEMIPLLALYLLSILLLTWLDRRSPVHRDLEPDGEEDYEPLDFD